MNAGKPLAATLLALVLLGFGPLAPKSAAATVNPCGTAQQALEKGRFQQADSLYAQLSSAGHPAATRACSRQGLIAVGALSAAQQLFAAGAPQQADEEIVRALNAVTLLTLPASVLPATGPNGIELAEALDADGFHQQAQQTLEQVVEADPQITLDRTARGILGQLAPGFLTQVGQFFQGMLNFVTSPIPASALLALLLIVGLNVYYRMRHRLHLQPFAFGTAAVPGADPDTLRERIWDELKRLSTEEARTADHDALRLDLAGPYEENLPLGSVGAAFGPFGDIICGLVKPFLRRVHGNSRLVTGVLRPKVSLRLDITTVDGVSEPGGSTVISHAELNLPEPDPAEDPIGGRFNQLALPAAAWIIVTRFKGCTLGGTKDWWSFAQFGTGCAWLNTKKLPEAEKYFGDAYATDHGNLAAALNLGALLVQTSVGDAAEDRARRERGYRLLQDVADATEGQTDDLQWYRARYLLPLAILDFGGPTGDGTQASDQDRKRAARYATELAAQLLEKERDPGDLPEKFAENGLGAALVLAAREHIPTTSELAEVSTDATDVDLAADPESLITLLRSPARKGTPEKLAAYAQDRCKQTPQLNYNLYRYQQNRVRICEQAETAVEELRDRATGEERERLDAQLDDLNAVRLANQAAMREFRRDVQNSGDPVLQAAVQGDEDFPAEADFLRVGNRADGDYVFGTVPGFSDDASETPEPPPDAAPQQPDEPAEDTTTNSYPAPTTGDDAEAPLPSPPEKRALNGDVRERLLAAPPTAGPEADNVEPRDRSA